MIPRAKDFKDELIEKIHVDPMLTDDEKKEHELYVIKVYAEFIERYVD